MRDCRVIAEKAQELKAEKKFWTLRSKNRESSLAAAAWRGDWSAPLKRKMTSLALPARRRQNLQTNALGRSYIFMFTLS
jgi:hypothetical protein